MDILHAPAPAEEAEALLLVYERRIVGHVTYELCETCASGVITEVDVATPLLDSGLGTRAVTHLRACYPDVAWHSRLHRRTTRDLAHRMGLPHTEAGLTCTHQLVREG
ncbi:MULTISPECIES: N-acetyltransferase [unclassified Streptomyces]|uniref:N-acetyltransferase n=1 Tax=unclassified Streptomyces TaxID=2593676 RepID=UPI000DB9738E|nr:MULTISPECIES: N-acetyltransferase [unclassified Streptomyces]MYT69644.1 N-acetyltransferase [Streptomyces sp. SID8367]RAJ70708.1 hypothetical protein K377_07784 [Streptomyces sp. PsTaAH-137]